MEHYADGDPPKRPEFDPPARPDESLVGQTTKKQSHLHLLREIKRHHLLSIERFHFSIIKSSSRINFII